MRVYYDRDADVGLIKKKKVVIVGYGSQGHAHAANLKDSGVAEVAVALRSDSSSRAKAADAGFKVMDVAEAAAWGDMVMMLTPDELQADIYRDEIAANIRPGAAIAFAHGLNVHFNLIEPRGDIDCLMIAPKGPGHTVRAEYVRGGGVPSGSGEREVAAPAAASLAATAAKALRARSLSISAVRRRGVGGRDQRLRQARGRRRRASGLGRVRREAGLARSSSGR